MALKFDSEFLDYLLAHEIRPGERLPTLAEMSREIGISVSKLREQLEVARSLGLVSVRPRVGIQREAFDFLPAIRDSALFAVASGEASFRQFSAVRRALETSFWDEAVRQLTAEDKEELRRTVARAFTKLECEPVHIPAAEHRHFHLAIFRHLDNPFVHGLLSAYWDIYETVQLTRLASYAYWLEVWSYHQRIAEALCADDLEEGRRLMVEHFELLPTVSAVPSNGDGNI